MRVQVCVYVVMWEVGLDSTSVETIDDLRESQEAPDVMRFHLTVILGIFKETSSFCSHVE